MNAFRVARAARPAFNAFRTVQRRGYADVAADKIQLSLALPHQVRSRMLECWKSLFG
jgi:F-type H+-transporting ATPase subunit delta